jgi:hypothetical protein
MAGYDEIVPIVIVSFDRPDYLQLVLESLNSQSGVNLIRHPIFLFQDGSVNDFSGRQYCDAAAAERNVAIFRALVPHGVPMVAEANLGVARNFDRAERFVFEALRAPAAIFLEDDLILGPYYLRTLMKLIDLALRDERIGYVGAFGNFRAPLEEQKRRASEIGVLGHNWAFGLTRRQWLLQKPYVDQYMDIVASSDYRGRDHARIAQLFQSWGLGVPGTSQDIAKTHATVLTNTARVSTFACFGRYIGQKGLHFDPEQFKRLGFDGSAMVEEDLFGATDPSAAQLDEIRRVVRTSAMHMNPAVPGLSTPPLADRATAGQSVLQMVVAARDAGQWDAAEDACRNGMSRFSDIRDNYGHPVFLKEALRLALMRGDRARASRLGEELRRMVHPKDPCVAVLFGRHALQVGDVEALRRYAIEVLACAPGQKEALGWIGRAA